MSNDHRVYIHDHAAESLDGLQEDYAGDIGEWVSEALLELTRAHRKLREHDRSTYRYNLIAASLASGVLGAVVYAIVAGWMS